jgi:hypothetical protein
MSLPNSPFNGMPGAETVQEIAMRHFGQMAVDENTPTFKSAGNPIWSQSVGGPAFDGYKTRRHSMTTPSDDVEIVGEVRNSVPGKDDICPLPEETPLPNGKHPNGKACQTMQVCPIDSTTGNPTIRFSIDTDNLNLPLFQSVVPIHYMTKETVGGTSYAAAMSGGYAQDVAEHIMGNGYSRPDLHEVYAVMEQATKKKSGRTQRDACTGWGVYDPTFTKQYITDHYPVVSGIQSWGVFAANVWDLSLYNNASYANAVKEGCSAVGGVWWNNFRCISNQAPLDPQSPMFIPFIYWSNSSDVTFSIYPNGRPTRP